MMMPMMSVGSGMEVFLTVTDNGFQQVSQNVGTPGGLVFMNLDSIGGIVLLMEEAQSFGDARFVIDYGTFYNYFGQYGEGVLGNVQSTFGNSAAINLSIARGSWASAATPASYIEITNFRNASGVSISTPSSSTPNYYVDPLNPMESPALSSLSTVPSGGGNPTGQNTSFSFSAVYPAFPRSISAMGIRFAKY